MGKPKLVDAAPAAMPRKRGPGGPWVTVRAHYGALPSVAGRDRRRVGESLPGWRACSRLRSEVRSQGRRSRCDGASERRCLYYQGASFGAPSPLKVEGRELKAQLARRRGNASAWLFEI